MNKTLNRTILNVNVCIAHIYFEDSPAVLSAHFPQTLEFSWVYLRSCEVVLIHHFSSPIPLSGSLRSKRMEGNETDKKPIFCWLNLGFKESASKTKVEEL